MKNVITLQSFLAKGLGLISAEKTLETRNLNIPEHFALCAKVNKERILEILNKYFNEVGGSYELIHPENEFTLDFIYQIPEEQRSVCVMTNFVGNEEIWVTTTTTG